MKAPGRVAVVSPREERRNSARGWAPLLRGAEVRPCASPADAAGADVIVLDAEAADAADWEARWISADAPPAVVVFGSRAGEDLPPLHWGADGEEVLAVLSDLMDRRALLGESEDLLELLRASGDRLEAHRRRLAPLAANRPSADDRAALARDVERLTRLAAVARFLAAPAPAHEFTEGLLGVVAKALGSPAVALARHDGNRWHVEGRRRLAARTALGILPDPRDADTLLLGRPSSRRAGEGFWIPLTRAPRAGLVGVTPAGHGPRESLGAEGVRELQALLVDALEARAATHAVLARQNQSERVVQTLRSGLLKVDAGERILLVNPALAAMLDGPEGRMEGRTLSDLFARDPHVVDLLRHALSRGEGLDDVETFVTSAGGRRVAVSLRASTLGDGTTVEGILVLFSDLARRKELEEEIRKAERLAALGRLSAGVAHEIRNPLAGIRTTAELLRGRVAGDTELVKFADVILEETERLDRIVGSLLQFAKPAPPRRQDVRAAELLERAARLAAGRASERGVRIRRIEGPDVPVVAADRDQLLQVLLNLLLNAVDATPAGGEVRLCARAADDELELVVEDEGSGIPANLRDRVFDPFFTTKPGGTGLGLSISQNILRQHGGRLRLERPDGGPSRAIAALPLRETVRRTHPGGTAWRTS